MKKTKKVMIGISSTALAISLTGCGEEEMNTTDMPQDNECTEWEWDEDDGVWECDDENSPYYHHYYFAGMFFGGKSSLFHNSKYQAYKKSSNFKGSKLESQYKQSGSTSKSTNQNVKGSSGFGSGTKSYGG